MALFFSLNTARGGGAHALAQNWLMVIKFLPGKGFAHRAVSTVSSRTF